MENQAHIVSAPHINQYLPHWFVTLTLLGYAVFFFFRMQHDPKPTGPLPVDEAPGVTWFFMLQLPHVPNARDEAMYGSTLVARTQELIKEGFHPLLFSTVMDRLRAGERLPRNTIALFLEQGYRTSVEGLWPAFQAARIPALLLTPVKPIEEADRGYISHYRAYTLRQNGLWDIGYFDGADPRRVTLWTSEEKPIPVGPEKSELFWIQDPQGGVLNQGPKISRFRRLFFDPSWSAADVANRMRAEIPVERSGPLGARMIKGRLWGVTLTDAERRSAPFNLHTTDGSRSGEVAWLGTRGLKRFSLHVQAQRVYGEWWFVFHENAQGDSVRVGLLNDQITIETWQKGKRTVLSEVPYERPLDPDLSIAVADGHIQVLNAADQILTEASFSRIAGNGLLRTSVYDRIYGAAVAEKANITITL